MRTLHGHGVFTLGNIALSGIIAIILPPVIYGLLYVGYRIIGDPQPFSLMHILVNILVTFLIILFV